MGKDIASPEHIMKISHGAWASFALSSALELSLFTHLGQDAMTADELATKAHLSKRGTQALLDALVATELLELNNHKYKNTKATAEFLVEGRPPYLGKFIMLQTSPEFTKNWLKLAPAVKSGRPQVEEGRGTEVKESPFWDDLVQSIAPLTVPVAHKIGADLKVASMKELHILDIGGGSGMLSLTLLQQNPRARATQLDWKNVNKISRKNSEKLNLADRFETIDGDFHQTDLGEKIYDLVIYSHIAHQENPAANIEVFRKIRRALRPQGTFAINDFLLDNDRQGNPFSLLFNCNMLLHTPEGASYTENDYRSWLAEAGFTAIKLEKTPGPSGLIYAH